MATENILIKFTADTSGITKSIDELQKMGKVTEDDAKKLAQLEGIAEGVADALKEAGVDAKTLNKAITDSANSGKTLRGQLSAARDEAVKVSQQFGAFSKEAREAAKRAAMIKDEIRDMDKVLDALNPEAKLNAFVNLGQGIQGAFQVATGSLQLFGVENERITKLAQQFQGVLNLTQGINSVLQLKDVYTQLRLVLGVTTAAQRGLNVAMLSNPFGAVAVAIAALVAAMIILEDKTVQYTLSEEKLNKIKQDGIDATDGLKDAEDALAIQRDKNATFNIQRSKALKDLEKELFDLKLNQIEAERLVAESTKEVAKAQKEANEAAEDGNKLLFLAKARVLEERKERLASAIELKRETDEAIENRKKEFFATRELITLKEIDARKEESSAKNKKKVQEETLQFMKELGLESALTNDEIIKISDEAFTKMSLALEIVDANAFQVKEAIVKINEELNNLQAIGVNITKTGTDFNNELFAKQDKRAEDSAALSLRLAQESTGFIIDLNRISTQNQINDLEDQKNKGIISEEQYQDKLKKIKTAAAKRDKELSLFEATLSAAGAIINALNVKPPSAVPTAVAIASVVGALNIARIVATPLPKFKEGTLNVGGGNLDSDGGMQAIIHRGEAVIPKDRNRDYHPTVRAIFQKQIKASDINAFVQSKLSGKIENRVSADIDVRKLSKAMNKGNGVQIENASIVGKVIARELASQYNRRNII